MKRQKQKNNTKQKESDQPVLKFKNSAQNLSILISSLYAKKIEPIWSSPGSKAKYIKGITTCYEP